MSDHLQMFERVSAAVCHKPTGMSASDCILSCGRANPVCRAEKRCRLAEKSHQQLKYVLHSLDSASFLEACPGSGKTEVVGLKAAYVMRTRQWEHAGIAILTFTKAAANVIGERVSQFASGAKFPHFVGTIDSWLHGYVLNPFGHLVTGYAGQEGDRSVRIVEQDSDAPFLHGFATKYKYAQRGTVLAHRFYNSMEKKRLVFDSGDRKCDELLNNLNLEQWRIEDLKNTKHRFWAKGFATYQDAEYICHQVLLDKPTLLKRFVERFPVLMVDECQDLSWGQMSILRLLHKQGASLHFVGDLDQAIYGFREVNPDKVREFIKETNMETLPLSENYRSVQPIVDVCCQIVQPRQALRGRTASRRDPACVYITYDKNNPSDVGAAFKRCLVNRGMAVERAAVLARGHALVSKLRPAAEKLPAKDNLCLATAVFLWKQKGVAQVDEALLCLGRVVSSHFWAKMHADKRHHYCPEVESSAIRWRLFLARVLDACTRDQEIRDLSVTWTAWAACVRSRLPEILSNCSPINSLQPPKGTWFSAPRNEGEKTVVSSLTVPSSPSVESDLLITTIHQAKGQTYDAVLLVSASDRKSKGGHWSQWLDIKGDGGEHARFAYVASSRPSELLVWAIPSGDSDAVKRLVELGFIAVKA